MLQLRFSKKFPASQACLGNAAGSLCFLTRLDEMCQQVIMTCPDSNQGQKLNLQEHKLNDHSQLGGFGLLPMS